MNRIAVVALVVERLWAALQRPVLVKVVDAFDRGTPTVDAAAYGVELGEPAERIRAALAALQDAGFIEAQQQQGELLIVRVCPLARQVLGVHPDTDLPTLIYHETVRRLPD